MKPVGIYAVAFGVAMGMAASRVALAETPDKLVRYVEATGTQYIDTGVVGRHGTKAECKVEWMELGDRSFLASRSGEYGSTVNENGRMYFCYCLNANGDMYPARSLCRMIWTIY